MVGPIHALQPLGRPVVRTLEDAKLAQLMRLRVPEGYAAS